MKKLNYFIVLAIFASTQLFAQITNTVTFQADMTQMIAGGFDSATDTIFVMGLDWDGGDVTVVGDRALTDTGTDNIFATTLEVTTSWAEGDSLRWKFRSIPGEKFVNGGWEGGFGGYDGYPMPIMANGSTYTIDPKVPGIEFPTFGFENTIEFTADLTSILGTGPGFFDPSTDKIMIRGLDWDGLGTVTSDEADRYLVEDEFSPGIFKTSLTVVSPGDFQLGDSTKWKFFAEPGDKFANGGWELGADRWHHYVETGSTVTLDPIVPNIFPLLPPLDQAIKIRFEADMNFNPVNAEDNSPIPLMDLEFVGVKGADSALGAWAGAWEPADTVVNGSFKGDNPFRQMIPMNDSGVNGDKVAGDNIWSVTVTFPEGTAGGNVEYKYGAWYTGASTVRPSGPMDNEGVFGTNHNVKIEAYANEVNAYNVWGDFDNVTGIKEVTEAEAPKVFKMDQNYPNPFNPVTLIKYSIPEVAQVRLVVHNILGQEVVTLVNQNQKAGSYEVDFNASNLTSGIYFYTITAGNFVQTKKMMLLK